jgi:hypothetical protein
MTNHDYLLSVTIHARLRGQVAAAEGDRSRYWRELASAMRMLGETNTANHLDSLAIKSNLKSQTNDTSSNCNRV